MRRELLHLLQFIGGKAGAVLVADQDQHRHAAPVIDLHGDAYRIGEAETAPY